LNVATRSATTSRTVQSPHIDGAFQAPSSSPSKSDASAFRSPSMTGQTSLLATIPPRSISTVTKLGDDRTIGTGRAGDKMRDIDKVIGALSSPVRREILTLIWGRERSAGDIAAAFALTKPTISQHLAVLRDADLVSVTAAGT